MEDTTVCLQLISCHDFTYALLKGIMCTDMKCIFYEQILIDILRYQTDAESFAKKHRYFI